jgi:hypothetical protein
VCACGPGARVGSLCIRSAAAGARDTCKQSVYRYDFCLKLVHCVLQIIQLGALVFSQQHWLLWPEALACATTFARTSRASHLIAKLVPRDKMALFSAFVKNPRVDPLSPASQSCAETQVCERYAAARRAALALAGTRKRTAAHETEVDKRSRRGSSRAPEDGDMHGIDVLVEALEQHVAQLERLVPDLAQPQVWICASIEIAVDDAYKCTHRESSQHSSVHLLRGCTPLVIPWCESCSQCFHQTHHDRLGTLRVSVRRSPGMLPRHQLANSEAVMWPRLPTSMLAISDLEAASACAVRSRSAGKRHITMQTYICNGGLGALEQGSKGPLVQRSLVLSVKQLKHPLQTPPVVRLLPPPGIEWEVCERMHIDV